jgi:hypothetical protein
MNYRMILMIGLASHGRRNGGDGKKFSGGEKTFPE